MENFSLFSTISTFPVLILIIMEDTHGDWVGNIIFSALYCLNPYYNGRYSWRDAKGSPRNQGVEVLILIIMEDTHGATNPKPQISLPSS